MFLNDENIKFSINSLSKSFKPYIEKHIKEKNNKEEIKKKIDILLSSINNQDRDLIYFEILNKVKILKDEKKYLKEFHHKYYEKKHKSFNTKFIYSFVMSFLENEIKNNNINQLKGFNKSYIEKLIKKLNSLSKNKKIPFSEYMFNELYREIKEKYKKDNEGLYMIKGKKEKDDKNETINYYSTFEETLDVYKKTYKNIKGYLHLFKKTDKNQKVSILRYHYGDRLSLGFLYTTDNLKKFKKELNLIMKNFNNIFNGEYLLKSLYSIIHDSYIKEENHKNKDFVEGIRKFAKLKLGNFGEFLIHFLQFDYQVTNGGFSQWKFNGYAKGIKKFLNIGNKLRWDVGNKLSKTLDLVESYVSNKSEAYMSVLDSKYYGLEDENGDTYKELGDYFLKIFKKFGEGNLFKTAKKINEIMENNGIK